GHDSAMVVMAYTDPSFNRESAERMLNHWLRVMDVIRERGPKVTLTQLYEAVGDSPE
ncbi:hypothetical protein KIPB_004602, partial [Kipferlia bialata]